MKRGEINHTLLAEDAQSITPARIRGRLYNVGDFPALGPGSDWVHGELVQFQPSAMTRVMSVLDRLEGCRMQDQAGSLYTRSVVETIQENGTTAPAWTYWYNAAHPALPPFDRLEYLPEGIWSARTAGAGPTGDEALEAYRRWVRGHGAHR